MNQIKSQERPRSKNRQVAGLEQELNPTLLTLPYSKQQTQKEVIVAAAK